MGGGAVFLNSAFMVFLVIFLETLAKIDARNLPKIFLTPRGTRGASKHGAAGGTGVIIRVLRVNALKLISCLACNN